MARASLDLVDRSSRPQRLRAPVAASKRQRIVRLRQRRRTMRSIAGTVGVSVATVSRVLAQAGWSRLPAMDAPPVVRRCEHAAPGDLLHLDTKKLRRIVRSGHRVTGDPRDSVDGAGWEAAHVAIDDHSRVAFAQVLGNEGKHSAVARSLHPTCRRAAHPSRAAAKDRGRRLTRRRRRPTD